MAEKLETKRWHAEALRLRKQGKGPLSIGVRLNVSWKLVVKYLEKMHQLEEELYDVNAKIYTQDESI